MTTGLSGTYAFNGIDFQLQPSTGKWVDRTNYGIDGNARTVYSQYRKFELKWELISTSDLHQIIDFYNGVSNSGSVVSCLPKWNDPDYTFYNYSGTQLQEPQVSEYFQGYIQSVTLLILVARTN